MNPVQIVNRLLTALVLTGALFCITFAVTVAVWAIDRDAPFVLLDYTVEPVRAGETTVVRGIVRRDLSRRCSVLFSRSFYDQRGTRYELTEGAQMMSSSALEAYNQRSPDMLAFSVTVPITAAPGVGSVMTVLDYQCNPTHQFWPVPMVLLTDIEVLPPTKGKP